MEHLQSLLDGSTVPILTAFLLGLLTAVSPCPLATNIAAVGYISKDLENRRRIFFNGLLYTFGRIVAYTLLGEALIAPALILIGLFMLFGHRFNLPKFGFSGRGEQMGRRGGWGAFLLGVLFSLAFCPTSGIFYFGMLIPMSAAETGGYLLPAVFAVATGLPVVTVAWILAYSVAGIGTFYNRMQTIQKWLAWVVGTLFIAVGIYYGIIYFC